MKQVTTSLKDQRKLLSEKVDKIKLWKSNKLNSVDSKLEELSSIGDKIDRAMCKLVDINKMLKKKF